MRKDIAGYDGAYSVSCAGRVYSARARRILRPHKDADGYLRIGLWDGKHQRKFAVHRLVAETFMPERRNILHKEVAHLDGDRANPRLDNLKWVSKVENVSHKRTHGTHQAGDFAGHRKLNSEQVAVIRLRDGSGQELAERFGVSRHTIYDIWQGVRWGESAISSKLQSPSSKEE